MKDADCTDFLRWALPRLGMRWAGFRRVRNLPDNWRAAFEQSGDEFCQKPEYQAPVRFLEQDIAIRLDTQGSALET